MKASFSKGDNFAVQGAVEEEEQATDLQLPNWSDLREEMIDLEDDVGIDIDKSIKESVIR